MTFFADPKEVLFVQSAIDKLLSKHRQNTVIQAALPLFSTLCSGKDYKGYKIPDIFTRKYIVGF